MPTTCRSKNRKPSPINIERLREVLDYDAVTGTFLWKKRISIRICVGDVAGVVRNTGPRPYVVIGIDGEKYLAHRLAWAHHYGEPPPPKIDHEDGDGCHNWISNLRASTHSQNLANMRKTVKSSTGFRGVYPYGPTGKKFEAKAMKDYRPVRFGIFDNPEDAYAAYCVGIKSLFGEFASVV